VADALKISGSFLVVPFPDTPPRDSSKGNPSPGIRSGYGLPSIPGQALRPALRQAAQIPAIECLSALHPAIRPEHERRPLREQDPLRRSLVSFLQASRKSLLVAKWLDERHKEIETTQITVVFEDFHISESGDL
jgi:hypothetical protein